MTELIQIGVIGTGGMGARHARNLAHRTVGARVVAVMDVDRSPAETVAAECGGAKIFSDAEQLIAEQDVQAVVIASPDPTHAPLTHACLRARKPVLCEKPLATSPAEAEAVVHAEAAIGQRLIQVGFMREYDSIHLDAKQILDRGDIGRPLLFRAVHVNAEEAEPRLLEDVINNSAIHDIHSARWLMGQEITSVHAHYIPAVPDRPDTCRLLVVHAALSDGALAVLEVNVQSGYGYEVDIEITCESGSVRTDSIRSPMIRQGSGRSQAIEADWLKRFDEAYVTEVRSWVTSILDDKPTGPNAWDGYVSLLVAEACILSAREGKARQVSVPARPALYQR